MLAAIGPVGTIDGSDVVDTEGRLCTGAFVDGHVQLDKSDLCELDGFTGKVAGEFFDERGRFKAGVSA